MKEGFDVVTGGAGFIGSHICRTLLRRGRRVRIIDNLLTGKPDNVADIRREFGAKCEIFEQDVRDLEGLMNLLEGAETVYHQAALTSVQKSLQNPLETSSTNVDGTLKVLLAARDRGIRKVVFATSTSVYGDSEALPKREEMKPNPISPYAVTKYVGELYCKIFSEVYQLPTLGLRYFNVFGPSQDPDSEYAAVIPRFISRMLGGQQAIIYGDGEQNRDFIFVDDVVSANLLATESNAQGLCLNIGCGRRFTLNQLVEILNEILGTKLLPIYQPARLGDVRHSQADIRLAEKTIGFKPTISLREGLRRTVKCFQKEALDSGRRV